MRFHHWLIQLIGWMVPPRFRNRWRREWQAEFEHREAALLRWSRLDQHRWELARRSTGAFWDALRLQPRRLEEEMFQDMRFGFRMMLKHKGFTAVAVLSLALGIGANTAIFSLVHAVLLRPLPFKDPAALVTVWERNPKEGFEQNQVAPGVYLEWREKNRVFKNLAIYGFRDGALTGEFEAERVAVSLVSTNLFQTLGVAPQLGREFAPVEETTGHQMVAVLSHSLWQRRFAGDAGIIGKTITIERQPITVVGVMPPKFRFPGMTGVVLGGRVNPPADLWIPMLLDGSVREMYGNHSWQVVGRLNPGVTLAQATAEMDTIQGPIEARNPDDYVGTHTRLMPLREQGVANIRLGILTLLGAVAMVLLIACANVANLMLARTAAREKEIAIRLALGAGWFRLARQLLTEALVLAGLGAGIGLLLAYWGIGLLKNGMGDAVAASTPGWDNVGLNFGVLLFTSAVTLLTTLLFGSVPAWRAARVNIQPSLQDGGRGPGGLAARQRFRSVLVAAQLAMSLMLLISATLLIKSFARLEQVDPGFRPAGLLAMQIDLPSKSYPNDQDRAAFFDRLLLRLRALPGAEAVDMTVKAPFAGLGFNWSVTVDGRDREPGGKFMTMDWRAITPGYLRTMGISIASGRGFSEFDTEKSQPVALINEAFARAYMPGQDPLGKRVGSFGGRKGEAVIVGVVRDFKQSGLEAAARPDVYTPQAQTPWVASRVIVARTTGDPRSLMDVFRREVQTADPKLPIVKLQTMDELISKTAAQPRFRTLLLSLFAALSLALAVIGVYGVMAYAVAQRTHEIGVRMALGAQTGDVLRMILRQGMTLIALGALAGLAGAFGVTRLLEGLLFGVHPTDLFTFVVTPFVLIGVASLACWLPALRAAKIDPMAALRAE
jgi:putative ABC transport system permease protein